MFFCFPLISFKSLMKFFWPSRSKAKGFAIQNHASKYPEKICSVSSNENPNRLLDDTGFKSRNKEIKYKELTRLDIKKIHWANRDFSEYRETA